MTSDQSGHVLFYANSEQLSPALESPVSLASPGSDFSEYPALLGSPSESKGFELECAPSKSQDVPQGLRKKMMLMIIFLSCFTVGMNDAATGANLPSIRQHYNKNSSEISLTFAAVLVGYATGCLGTAPSLKIFTMSVMLAVAATLHCIGALLLALAVPYPAFIFGLFLMGLGGGATEAAMSSVLAQLGTGTLMNLIYSSFSVGGSIAPLLVGGFEGKKVPWQYYYIIPCCLASLGGGLNLLVFRNYALHEEVGASLGFSRRLRATFRPAVAIGLVLCFMTFAIVEIIASWTTSYLLEVRGASEAVSRYQISFYWAGICIGRLCLATLAKFGVRWTNSAMLVCSAAFLVGLWKIDNGIGQTAMIALSGFAIGPVTPNIISLASTRVPPSLTSLAVSITLAFGLAGAGAGPTIFAVAVEDNGLKWLPLAVIVLCAITAAGFFTLPSNAENTKVRRPALIQLESGSNLSITKTVEIRD